MMPMCKSNRDVSQRWGLVDCVCVRAVSLLAFRAVCILINRLPVSLVFLVNPSTPWGNPLLLIPVTSLHRWDLFFSILINPFEEFQRHASPPPLVPLGIMKPAKSNELLAAVSLSKKKWMKVLVWNRNKKYLALISIRLLLYRYLYFMDYVKKTGLTLWQNYYNNKKDMNINARHHGDLTVCLFH